MIRTILFLSKLFIVYALALGAVQAETPRHRVVLLTENFPPFNMSVDGKNFARDEKIEGANSDVVREMFQRAGIAYDLSLRFPWDRIYNLALEKPSYGIFSTTMQPARRPLFKWVGPLSSTRQVLVAAPGKVVQVADLESAKAYRIGAYKNGAVAAFLDSRGVTYQTSLRDQENIRKLLAGEIDLWATTDPVFRYYAMQAQVSGLTVVTHLSEGDQEYLALNLGTPDEVVRKLQATLDDMRQRGDVERLQAPYLGE